MRTGRSWNAESCIEAIRRWAAEHDEIPPRARDWSRATDDHPHAITVAKHCGGWNAAIRAAGLTPAPAWLPTSESTRPEQLALMPHERSAYGATITIRRVGTNERDTLCLTERTAMAAVAAACEECDRREGSWVISCISTPPTIYRDLVASRLAVAGPADGSTLLPEPIYLKKADRMDLLDPRLASHGPDERVDPRGRLSA